MIRRPVCRRLALVTERRALFTSWIWDVFSSAWRETRDVLRLRPLGSISVAAMMFVGTTYFVTKAGEHQVAMDQAAWVLGGLKALVYMGFVFFLIALVRAAYGLDKEKLDRIFILQSDLAASDERFQPCFELLCGTEPPYTQVDLNANGGQVHLSRLRVRNLGLEPIQNVQVRLTRVRNPQSGAKLTLKGIPATLHLMNNNITPYRESFSLSGRGEEYVDVVTVDLSSGIMFVQHVVSNVGILLQRSGCPYGFTIRVTGDRTEKCSVEFEIGLEQYTEPAMLGYLEKLYMRRIGEADSD